VSRADGVLVCVVSRKPWEMFAAGVKGAEYRADKPGKDYWQRIILDECGFARNYETLRVPLGYAKDRPILDIPILFIDWGLPNPAWTCGIIAPKDCFRIHVDIAKRRRIA
jgi:hypothetical protein